MKAPSNILPLNEVIPLAYSLARKEAHRPDDVDDLVQEGLFAYHKAEQRYQLRHTPVQKPWSLARTTLQRAIRGYYWHQCEWKGRGDLSTAVSLNQNGFPAPSTLSGDETRPHDGAVPSDIPALSSSGFGEQFELLELDDYFATLERTLGATARLIAENLLMPSGECAVRILCEIRDKRELQVHSHKRTKRHQPRGVKRAIRITPRLVREALRISPNDWDQSMSCIRDFTRKWLSQ